MNNDNLDFKDNFLNEVNITSNIRGPGEYKYFYFGENHSGSDKSFLVFSTMWYSDRITDDMEIICSCYNSINIAQLYINKKTNLYNLYIYKNIIDYRNENMSLKLLKIINIIPYNKSEQNSISKSNTNQTKNEKDYMNAKIYFASNNYLLLNEKDYRILLIDLNTSNYVTIFSKNIEDKELLYNIFDTYDENFIINGEQKIRTYVFLSIKYQERKTPTYRYTYFIIQKGIDKIIHLYPINLDLGNSEPIGLKIKKIIHKDKNNSKQKCFFLFCFLSTSICLQLVTDYDNLTLHQMFQKYCKVTIEDDFNRNINDDEINFKKPKFWTSRNNIKKEKNQFCQGMNISLNINYENLCSLTYYFETKGIISYNFNYSDPPEELFSKIIIPARELNLNNGFDIMKRVDKKIRTYNFIDFYQFKTNCFFGFSGKNLVIGEKNVIHIYDENTDFPVFTYEFFQESLTSLINIEGIGCIFLLTGKKLFKIIYNQRYKLFNNDFLFSKNKIHYYTINYNTKKNNNDDKDKLIFPLFEYKPEDIWNAYCNNLDISPIKFKGDISDDIEEEVEFHSKNNNIYEKKDYTNVCVLCNKKCDFVCSHCGSRYYCCYEHFKYDYFSYHFFECELIQFFKREDIMNIPDLEIRYKILYNELIKVSGRILNFIFRRIYTKQDYIYFLNMILILVDIFTNFGFNTNLSDFCSLNFNSSNDKRKQRYEKVIFYLEALFYYVQLNFLKCTFALRGGLYNLTDCYLKIIKNDIAPKLTPKSNKRLISLKYERFGKKIIYNNSYFSEFETYLFFDIKKYVKYLGNNNYIDVIEEYIIKHLKALSLLTKFKIKINSSIEVQNTIVDINLLFDDHYSENTLYKNIVPYAYFSTSFYLVEIGKITQTVKLLRRMVGFNFDILLDSKLSALTYYNLGLLQYALGYFDIGIHNIEIAYKTIVSNNFSDKIKLYVIDSLGLAYLNQKNLFKAYILIQTSIKERNKINKKKNQIKCNRLHSYLNYIVDLYEYNFISKTRFLIKKKYGNYDKHRLLKFVLGEEDKELVISEQNLGQFIKVVEFVWKLSDTVLNQLNIDNPPKAVPTNNREEFHHERNLSFNSDVSQTSTFIYKENINERDEFWTEYEEDIEVKTSLYDTLLSRQQQQEFKELKTIYLKRDIILRDPLGSIEKFNINFDPIYADEFQKIIEKLKIDFLLKEIFYCFQNEKWRDELYNYNQNNILFGLSKYLKLVKTQYMMAIERSKNILLTNKEKKESKKIKSLLSLEDEKNNNPLTDQYLDNDWVNEKENDENNQYNLLVLNYLFLDINKPDSSPNIASNKYLNHSSMTKAKEETNSFNSLKDSLKTNKTKKGKLLNKSKVNSSSSSSEKSSVKNKDKKEDEKPQNIKLGSNNIKKNILKNRRKSEMVNYKQKLIDEKELDKKNKKKKSVVFSNNISKNYNEFIKEKKSKNGNIKDNSSSSSSSIENKGNNSEIKKSQDFTIVSQVTTFCYIYYRRISSLIDTITKKEKIKKRIKERRKTQWIIPKKNNKFNELNNISKRKNSLSIMKLKKERTFIEEINNRHFNLSNNNINNEEELGNKKAFELIQKNNRKNTYITTSNDNISNKNSDRSNTFLKMTKKDILLGYNSRKMTGDISLIEKKISNKNRPSLNKSIFDLEKILSESKINNSIISNKKIYKGSNKELNEGIKEEISKDFTDYKNNSLIKHFMNNTEKKNNYKSNKINERNIYCNYSYYLKKSEISKKRGSNLSVKKNKMSFYNKEKNGLSFKDNRNNYLNKKRYGFKSKEEREKKLESEALKYLKLELNKQTQLNKNRLINSSGINMNSYKSVLSKYKKNSQPKYENINDTKIKRKESITEKNNKDNSPFLYKNKINKVKKFNDKNKNKFIRNDNNPIKNKESFTSRLSNKLGKYDEKFNKNILYESSSYIKYINNNSSKYISNNENNSNIYKKKSNRSSIDISNDNINPNSKRIILNNKLSFIKKKSIIRSKENSGMPTLSNTNAHTPKRKNKIKEGKNKNSIDNSNIKIKKGIIKNNYN